MKNLPKGTNLEFTERPYLISIYEDTHPLQVIQKSAQCGLTICGIAKTLWFADTHKVSVIYTFPTRRDVIKFTAARINPIIMANPDLRDKLLVNQLELKQFGNSFVYFRGTKSESEALSVDADMLVHDERDKGDPDIYDQYASRLYASKYKYEMDFSTPTFINYGINALYEDSDKHEWHVRCSHCNDWQVLDMDKNIYRNKFICAKCGGAITDEDRLGGCWVPTESKKGKRGYHISQLCTIQFSAQAILQEQKARKAKNFANLILGLPYEGSSTGLTKILFLDRAFVEGVQHEETGHMTSMGVDQGDTLYAVVGRMNQFGVIEIIHLEKATNFYRIGQLMNQYGVIKCVIDALPNTHNARDLVNDFPSKVKLAFYKDVPDEIREVKAKIMLDRTETLDDTVDRVYSGEIQLYPRDDLVDEFIRHCCSVKRVVEEDEETGIQKHMWIKTGSDHFLHALNYLNVAFAGTSRPLYLPNPNKIVIGQRDFSHDFSGRGNSNSLVRRLPVVGRDIPNVVRGLPKPWSPIR